MFFVLICFFSQFLFLLFFVLFQDIDLLLYLRFFLIVTFVRRVCLTVTIFNNILSFYMFFFFYFGRDCLKPNIWCFNKLFSCTTFQYSFLASPNSLIYSLSFLSFLSLSSLKLLKSQLFYFLVFCFYLNFFTSVHPRNLIMNSSIGNFFSPSVNFIILLLESTSLSEKRSTSVSLTTLLAISNLISFNLTLLSLYFSKRFLTLF